MTSTDYTAKVGRMFWIIIILTLLILPFVNFFVVDYFEYIFSGDITKKLAYDVMYYLSESIAFLLKYITLSTIVFSVFAMRGRLKTTALIFSFISLTIPYASLFFIAYYETTNFSALFEYYLVSASINFGIDALIAVLTLVFAAIIRSKSKYNYHKSLIYSLIVGACILFLAELSVLVYETVVFVLELKYEYYDSMTPSEMLKVTVNYVRVIVRSILGYCVMRIYTNILEFSIGTDKRKAVV